MPIVMIRTNLVYMTAKIYMIVFIGIVKVVHNNVPPLIKSNKYLSIIYIKNAPLINQRDAFIMIYIINNGQQ